MISFTVVGVPAAQGSKRHVGHGVMVESSKRLKPWREAVRSAATSAREQTTAPLFGRGVPVHLILTVFHLRPRAHYRTGRHSDELRPDAPVLVARTPDLSKVIRSCEDAMTDAGVWHDDAQVALITARQEWADWSGAEIDVVGVES